MRRAGRVLLPFAFGFSPARATGGPAPAVAAALPATAAYQSFEPSLETVFIKLTGRDLRE